jgi:phenylalanine ammonia-lyase
MQAELYQALEQSVSSELSTCCGNSLSAQDLLTLTDLVFDATRTELDNTTKMDCEERMTKVASAASTPIIDYLTSNPTPTLGTDLSLIPAFRTKVASTMSLALRDLQQKYLNGQASPTPASYLLGVGTRPIYEFVRTTLGVNMHGKENLDGFAGGLGVEGSIGASITAIYEVRFASPVALTAQLGLYAHHLDRQFGTGRWTMWSSMLSEAELDAAIPPKYG